MDISIIIPVYNTEQYLKQCIDSIIMQEGISKEIILVDDGSTDNSPLICDRYASQYNYIKTIHIQNSGPATAKNAGLEIAQGDYIALTDSDDKMSPTMLSEMLSAARQYMADIVCCNYMQIDESGKISHTEATGDTIILDHQQGLIHLLSKDKIHSQCWTKIYRNSFLSRNQIRNENGLRTEEDFIFNIKAFCKSNLSVIIDKPLYIYTHRESSLAHDYFRKHISQFIDNRLLRVRTTDELIKNESKEITKWSHAHNIMYYNELIGKVALFPTYYKDKRMILVFKYIRSHSTTLFNHLSLCGFSMLGAWMLMILPIPLYMKYRSRKAK